MDIQIKETKTKWTTTLNLEINKIKVIELKEMICNLYNKENNNQSLQPIEIHLLSGGKFLKNDELTLEESNIKSSILVHIKPIIDKNTISVNNSSSSSIITDKNTTIDKNTINNSNHNVEIKNEINNEDKNEDKIQTLINKEHERQLKLQKIREAAIEMSKRENGGYSKYEKYHFVLEDQQGKKITLPKEEQESLIMGMILQQKGKTFLYKNKSLKDAYDLFIVSEESFKKVNTTILSNIDNYAILLIDIVWCMYLLNDPNMLYDAIYRIKLSESILQTCHGTNLERLLKIENNRIELENIYLYIKLNLLKGIICFELKDYKSSYEYLLQCDLKLRNLNIDDNLLIELFHMGFTKKESIRALQVNNKNINLAINYLLEKYEIKKKKNLEEQERNLKRKRQLKYGNTKFGKFINLDLLDQLKIIFTNLDEEVIIEALKESNNDELQTIDLLTNHLNELKIKIDKDINGKYLDIYCLKKLINIMGFNNLGKCCYALKKVGNVVEEAMELLLNGKVNPLVMLNEDELLSIELQLTSMDNVNNNNTTVNNNDNNNIVNNNNNSNIVNDNNNSEMNENDEEEEDEEEDEEERTPLDRLFNNNNNQEQQLEEQTEKQEEQDEMEDFIDEELIDAYHQNFDEDLEQELRLAFEKYMKQVKEFVNIE
ncbi:hypothetical protein ABK040_016046 [Willaertia magna]